jgi:hypothetical protein
MFDVLVEPPLKSSLEGCPLFGAREKNPNNMLAGPEPPALWYPHERVNKFVFDAPLTVNQYCSQRK